MEKVSQESFIHFLNQELAHRCESNSRYSMRAFATHLDLDFSNLSKIMKGQVRVGQKLVKRVGHKLGLSSEEIAQLFLIKPDRYNFIENHIEQINRWWHYAILELTHLPHFQSNARWIANTLNIEEQQVQEAIDQLLLAEMLTEKNGEWLDQTGRFTNSYHKKKTSLSKRQLQKSFLNLSLKKIDEVDFSHRDHSTIVCAINKSEINEAKEMIEKFRRDFDARFSAKTSATDVYALSIGCFPLNNELGDTQ